MLIYLDNCCYNRPYDDQSQDKIHFESEAIVAIVRNFKITKHKILGSQAVDFEIDKINDIFKRETVKAFYESAISKKIMFNETIKNRRLELSIISNLRTLDAYHLAFAEYANANFLLTTDIKFEKACLKLNLKTKVLNPITFLTGVMQ